MTIDLAKKYQPISLSGRNSFDYEFLRLVTSNKDIMSDDTYDAIFDIVKNQIAKVSSSSEFTVGDNTDVAKYLSIASNMLEYLQDTNFRLN
jgi:hypothetical protein